MKDREFPTAIEEARAEIKMDCGTGGPTVRFVAPVTPSKRAFTSVVPSLRLAARPGVVALKVAMEVDPEVHSTWEVIAPAVPIVVLPSGFL
jgi:hypothetical protein